MIIQKFDDAIQLFKSTNGIIASEKIPYGDKTNYIIYNDRMAGDSIHFTN